MHYYFFRHQIYFLGPGDYKLIEALPPGTDMYQGEIVSRGHLMIPRCEFDSKSSFGFDDSSVSNANRDSKNDDTDPMSQTTQAFTGEVIKLVFAVTTPSGRAKRPEARVGPRVVWSSTRGSLHIAGDLAKFMEVYATIIYHA